MLERKDIAWNKEGSHRSRCVCESDTENKCSVELHGAPTAFVKCTSCPMLHYSKWRKFRPSVARGLYFTCHTTHQTTGPTGQLVLKQARCTQMICFKDFKLDFQNSVLACCWEECERISRRSRRSGWKTLSLQQNAEESSTSLNRHEKTAKFENETAKCTFRCHLWKHIRLYFLVCVQKISTYHFILVLVVRGHQAPFDIQWAGVFGGQSELALQLHTLTTGLLY